jgi:hypothetical protein
LPLSHELCFYLKIKRRSEEDNCSEIATINDKHLGEVGQIRGQLLPVGHGTSTYAGKRQPVILFFQTGRIAHGS